MKHIKKFNQINHPQGFQTNEEMNLKGMAAGALIALMTACQMGKVDGEKDETYTGDMLVKRIEMQGGRHNFFVVHGRDNQGQNVDFRTDNLTFNVGDSIHVDFSKEEAYPLKDKGYVGSFSSERSDFEYN